MASESVMRRLPSIHPGEVLLAEFLIPMGISQSALARAAVVPPRRINKIVLGKCGVMADTAVRLAAALGKASICPRFRRPGSMPWQGS